MGIVIAQVVIAAALGAVIGIEREFGAQPAGLRTHMLVSLGAALFTLAGAADFGTGADPVRVAAQVVTGIGFLGGGAIFKEGVNIRGLTTAGSLWVTASIGLAVGLRQWVAAVVTTLVAMGVLWLVKLAEQDWLPRRHLLEAVLFVAAETPFDEIERHARQLLPKMAVRRIDFAGNHQSIVLNAHAGVETALADVAERLRRIPGVQGVEVTR